MSISVYGRIKNKCINEDFLENSLVEFFSHKSDVIRKKDRNCITYERAGSENEVTISFIDEKKPPYNVYDSTIINDEFEYVQLILFDIKKEEASIDRYKEIIRFFIYIKEKIDSDILVTSDVHNDICLLTGKKVIWCSHFAPIF